jgi:hypothetical protein
VKSSLQGSIGKNSKQLDYINEQNQEEEQQSPEEPEYGSKEYVEAIEKSILLERNIRATQ